MIRFALVFLATLLADVCWTLYFQRVAAKRAAASAFWSAAIIALGAFTVTEYVKDPLLVLAAVLGAYAGTWITVRGYLDGVKILWGAKDGGPESNVRAWGFEAKCIFSVLLLRFGPGSREAFHTHAFNAVSWVLRGALYEREHVTADEAASHWYGPSFKPVHTFRNTLHRVSGSDRPNWVLSFRGPWADGWLEERPLEGGKIVELRSGRVEK